MAFDEKLAGRVRSIISATQTNVEEKKMFSGLCFMVNDKMCVAVDKNRLMVRLDPVIAENVSAEAGVIPMVMGGRTMKGYLFVSWEVLKTKKQLSRWIQWALDYNKIAKPSKKKRK